MAMRWIFDMEGCLFPCSYLEDWKASATLNLLRMGMKDWWNLVISSYTPKQRVVVTWGQFLEIFCTEYVPLVQFFFAILQPQQLEIP